MARGWFDFIARHGRPQAGLDHHAQTVRHPPGTPAPTIDSRAMLTAEQPEARAAFTELERIKRSIA